MNRALMLLTLCLALPAAALAQDFDPYLHQKAQEYTDWLIQWHSGDLGGVSDILFTDDTRTEMERTWGAGDSEDWTATYLVSQAIRYMVTGEQQARDEVIRIGNYLHVVHEITGDPGYIARYAALDEPPWNVEYPDGTAGKHLGEGAWEGYFWSGHQSRDKYITWYWAMAWAYDAITDDAAFRAQIVADVREMTLTLDANDWTIIDPWGDIWSAAAIDGILRLQMVAEAAHIINEPEFWNLVDEEFEDQRAMLPLQSFAWFNKYFEYYAFINGYSAAQGLFRYWPDRERFEYIWGVWNSVIRPPSGYGHNPFFDSVQYSACLRVGGCEPAALTYIEEDSYESLTDMNEAPNWQRHEDIRQDLELDPFSVWADDVLSNFPWVEELFGFDIDPVVNEAREISDRCWESVLWERSPHVLECDDPDMPRHVTHGADFLIGYWLGVYYGILPGGGPYGDDDLIEPGDDDDDDNDDDNDDNDDDTTPADDDTPVDDDDDTTPTDDDDTPVDDDDDSPVDDDDDTTPTDDDDSPAADDDDDDDDGGCSC
jgi:hypothetical protein